MNTGAYVVQQQIGECKICSVHQDLRCGVCYHCSDRVEGVRISEVTHKLWDVKNPSNVWFFSENHN